MPENFKMGISFLDDKDYDNANKCFLKSYENGIKKSEYYLRKIRYEKGDYITKSKKIDYENIQSKLGFGVELPSHFEKLNTIDDRYFDIMSMEKQEYFEFFNIKTTGFLIEIPSNCKELVSVNSIIKNMTNLDEIKNYENQKVKGKLIKSKSVQGVLKYTLLTSGNNGIYEFKIEVDEFLFNEYKDIMEHIFNSFYLKEEVKIDG